MIVSDLRWLVAALVASLVCCSVACAEVADIILPVDSRFNVFELSNSAGGGTFASPVGTVLYSFASKDSRYCRGARFASDNTLVLACREERGWKIEATSNLVPGASTITTAFGGGNMQEVNDAVDALRTSAGLLDELEVIEAANRGWRNPDPVDEQSLDARDILEQTSRVYRASKSYIDTGTVQTVYISPSRERIGETQFKTAYVAPSEFRFESSMRDFGSFEANFIAWRNRDEIKQWYNLDSEPLQDAISIESALDAGAGISRDTSGLVPGLLFPGMKLGGDIVRLRTPARLEDEQIDGFDCFQVQGTRWPHKGPTIVWIDKESYLIRRIYEEDEIKGAETKTTWFYKPAINVPVEADSLLLNEPQSQ